MLGIFLVNLPYLAMPIEMTQWPLVSVELSNLFLTTKIVALFSMLFGMGLVLQMQRARVRGGTGRPFGALYARRLIVLAVVGLLHGFLLFMGDILFVYAVAGSILFLARDWAPRNQIRAAAALFAIGMAIQVAGSVLLEDDTARTHSTATTSTSNSGPNSAVVMEPPRRIWNAERAVPLYDLLTEGNWSAAEIKAYADGPLETTLSVTAVEYIGWLLLSTLAMSFNARVLAWFFLGAAILKLGLHREENRALHRLVFLLGTPIGLGLTWASSATSSALLGEPLSEVGATLTSLGYFGGLLWWARAGTDPLSRTLQAGLAAAGRMTLTNYLGQSLIGCLLFRWYGFGLYAELSHAAVLGIASSVFVVQVLFSSLWLSVFRYGPLEWLSRAVIYAGAPPGTRPSAPMTSS